MKKLYINSWLALGIILIVGVGATTLIMHTISTTNAEDLSYLSLAGS